MSMPLDPRPRGTAALAVPLPTSPFALMTDPAAGSPFPGGPFRSDADRPGPWFLDIVGVLRRHPLVMLLAAAACAWLGFQIGNDYHTKLWPVEGRLRYLKPPTPDGAKSAYESMSLPTYADLVTSDELLRPVAAAFADRLPADEPVRLLKKELKVDVPRSADVIEIRWDAADPALAADVINRLMANHIVYTNNLRRNTILRQSADLLRHRIIDSDTQMRRIAKTVQEYQARVRANTPIEKLEATEIDAYHAQRRRGIIDQIAAEQAKIKDKRISEDSLKAVVRLKEEHLRARIIPELELLEARRQLHDVRESIKLSEDEIRRLEDRYREVPIEYANSKLLELQVKKTEAELDLKLLQDKSVSALAKRIPVLDIDPQDDEWAKLRQRLIGPDSPEFEVIKVASQPSQPAGSNRKVLTLAAAGGPFALVFLSLAYLDHRRSVRSAAVIRPMPDRTGFPTGRDESALLSVRIQQWIQGRPGVSDELPEPPTRDVIVEPNKHSNNKQR